MEATDDKSTIDKRDATTHLKNRGGGAVPLKNTDPIKRDQPERRCYRCGNYGHLARNCQNTIPAGNFVVNQTSSDSGPTKFLKTATVNSTDIAALIDPGSSDCIMRHRAAAMCKLQIMCQEQELYGFGSTNSCAVRSIGWAETDIEIDDVVCSNVKVIVVDNSAVPVDLLVGRTWTEQEHIAYLRIGDELRIGYKDELPFCNIQLTQLKSSKGPLRVKETVTLPKGTVC